MSFHFKLPQNLVEKGLLSFQVSGHFNFSFHIQQLQKHAGIPLIFKMLNMAYHSFTILWVQNIWK